MAVERAEDLNSVKARVDAALADVLREEKGIPRRLREAMGHSLLAGGKRLRPALLLWTYDAFAGGEDQEEGAPVDILTAACGLEMIHTYSLIHDDLPAMDDDDLRRGRPTCHVVYGEATAILAGDALQALGFTLLARAGGAFAGPLVRLVGEAVGPAGMVGGQQLDLDAEGQEVSARDVGNIHRLKTAALLGCSLACGALLAGAPEPTVQAVSESGLDLGLAFQGADDLLDVSASVDQLGKTPGKDAAVGKATWIRVEGVERARERTRRLGERGTRRLEDVLPPGREPRERLLALAHLMWNREA